MSTENEAKKLKKDMSAFAIYAFVITGLYILYMAIVILTDLFVKKGQKKESVEEFNNSGIGEVDEDSSTYVGETPDGYSVSHSDVSDVSDVDDSEGNESEVSDDIQEDQPVYDVPDDDELLQQESMESQVAYESLKSIQDQMDPVRPSYQDEYNSGDFAVMMSQPMKHGSRILRHYVDKF